VKRISRASVLAAGVFFAATLAAAQPPPAGDPHAAARQLVDIMTIPLKSGQLTEAFVQGQIQANPALKPYADIMDRWMTSVFAGGEFEAAMVKLYEDAFTAEDLKLLLAFYDSPIGRKAIAAMPDLMQKGMTLGITVAQRHTAELTAMIEERDRELKGTKAASPEGSPSTPPR
jgi:hypothetical protein